MIEQLIQNVCVSALISQNPLRQPQYERWVRTIERRDIALVLSGMVENLHQGVSRNPGSILSPGTAPVEALSSTSSGTNSLNTHKKKSYFPYLQIRYGQEAQKGSFVCRYALNAPLNGAWLSAPVQHLMAPDFRCGLRLQIQDQQAASEQSPATAG